MGCSCNNCAWTPLDLDGKVVVTMSNALRESMAGPRFVPLIPPRGSVAASVQAIIPDALVAATLHHVPAREFGDLNEPLHSDVLICRDHVEATHAVAAVLQLNTKYETRVGLTFTGLDVRWRSHAPLLESGILNSPTRRRRVLRSRRHRGRHQRNEAINIRSVYGPLKARTTSISDCSTKPKPVEISGVLVVGSGLIRHHRFSGVEMMTSTRRFAVRPSASELSAIGRSSPYPTADNLAGSIP